jgi:uncharacterized membrane protein YqgA involved in biofilm formation
MTGTLINVGTVLAGTAIGTLFGARLTEGLQQRVLYGLALVVLVIGVENALKWDTGHPRTTLCVLGGVLLGGLAGEAIGIEGRLMRLGEVVQARTGGRHGVAEAFFTASLLFCVGPLTIVGAIQDGLNGDYQLLATKSVLDGFAAIALSAALGPGVAFAAVTVLVIQGGIALAAGLFDHVLAEGSEALAALTSAGGILIIGISLKLADLKDVKVGNFLPALVLAPALVGFAKVFV